MAGETASVASAPVCLDFLVLHVSVTREIASIQNFKLCVREEEFVDAMGSAVAT